MKGVVKWHVEKGTFTPDRLCDVNFSLYPMKGGDGITSALERFDPFLCSRTSIEIYLRYMQRRALVEPLIGRYGGRCPPWCGSLHTEDLKNHDSCRQITYNDDLS